jgi:hypothetical protein
MAESAVVAKRRQNVADLWLRGMPVLRIAKTLQVPHRTVRSDILALRKELALERVTDLEACRDRSVAVFRKAQQEAWLLFARLDNASSSKLGALNTIVAVETTIARLEGTLGPNVSINQTTNVNLAAQEEEFERIQETIAQALMPYTDARIAVAAALANLQ